MEHDYLDGGAANWAQYPVSVVATVIAAGHARIGYNTGVG